MPLSIPTHDNCSPSAVVAGSLLLLLAAVGLAQGAGFAPRESADGSLWLDDLYVAGVLGVASPIIPYGDDDVVAGSFRSASGRLCRNIARWDGQAWYELGRGVDFRVEALAEYNGLLIAGGWRQGRGDSFEPRVAIWDGNAWESIVSGGAGQVLALHEYGGRLYIGGRFRLHEGASVALARWDGRALELVEDSIATPHEVADLHVFGNVLYAAGSAAPLGDKNVLIAKYDGDTWVQVYGANNDRDVSMERLSVSGGSLTVIERRSNLRHILRRSGRSWQSLGEVPGARRLVEYDGVLHVLTRNQVLAWSGTEWLETVSAKQAFLSRWGKRTLADASPEPHRLFPNILIQTRVAVRDIQQTSQGFVRIQYELPRRAAQVDLRVFDVRGRMVRRLAGIHGNAGRNRYDWNRLDDRGESVLPGVYFIRLHVPDGTATSKLILTVQ